MDVNGESMDRRWRKEIHVLELIIGAQWLLVAQFENRHVSYDRTVIYEVFWRLILKTTIRLSILGFYFIIQSLMFFLFLILI